MLGVQKQLRGGLAAPRASTQLTTDGGQQTPNAREVNARATNGRKFATVLAAARRAAVNPRPRASGAAADAPQVLAQGGEERRHVLLH
jgi:hypothetical protein